ncbi:hypothetical protein NO1_1522 [Candidatus Termititenax aidoneus]|uniref:Uncharacterized protein n=1 Tax=Termititenax aidoneus TaxID=2218524 RepID=A0A388TCT5_TERA1|nr:hypothetical protein NO1_1522 [Candidatus Termititenax aidoneus]
MVARVLHLLKQDQIALYVALIMRLALPLPAKFLANYLSATQLDYLLLALAFVLTVFVQIFAADCARQMIVRKKILVGQTLAYSLKRYVPTLFFGSALPLLLVITLGVLLFSLLGSQFDARIALLLLPLVFLTGLCETLFPVVYVLSNMPVYRIYYLLGNYLLKNFRHALQVLFFILLTALLVNLAAAFLQKLPYAEFLAALLSGFQAVFVVYGLVVMFLGNNQVSELV